MGDGLPMLFSLVFLSLMTVRTNSWTHRGPAIGLTGYWTRRERKKLSALRFAWSVRTSKVGQWMRRISQKKATGPFRGGYPLLGGEVGGRSVSDISNFQNTPSTRPRT